ncbi:MAG: pyridoxamine 5'-phosphate oxidase family protein [Acidimicrobiales bacterium]
MHWSAFDTTEPRLADLGREKLGTPGVVLIGTLRADGSPRISPVESLFWRGDLWLSMLWGSKKAADLLRDPRLLVHNIVTSRDGSSGEYKVRGRAVAEADEAEQAGYAAAIRDQAGWDPVPGAFHLFWVDVAEVTFIRYEDATGDQFVTLWPAGREFVRRGTTPTSLGEPQQYSALLSGDL